MAKTFSLEIVATDRIFYKGECEHLVITAIDGLLGILAGHEPLVTALPAGELKYMVAENGAMPLYPTDLSR